MRHTYGHVFLATEARERGSKSRKDSNARAQGSASHPEANHYKPKITNPNPSRPVATEIVYPGEPGTVVVTRRLTPKELAFKTLFCSWKFCSAAASSPAPALPPGLQLVHLQALRAPRLRRLPLRLLGLVLQLRGRGGPRLRQLPPQRHHRPPLNGPHPLPRARNTRPKKLRGDLAGASGSPPSRETSRTFSRRPGRFVWNERPFTHFDRAGRDLRGLSAPVSCRLLLIQPPAPSVRNWCTN